jgi:hypothetical protein
VTTQINAIELNPELVNMAYEMGLNVSKTCEIFNPENTSVRNAGFAITTIQQKAFPPKAMFY